MRWLLYFKPFSSHAPQSPLTPLTTPIQNQLETLCVLRRQKLITEEEYEARRRKILDPS